MKTTLIYSRPCKMKDKSVFQAMEINYLIGSLSECENLKKEVEKLQYETKIN